MKVQRTQTFQRVQAKALSRTLTFLLLVNPMGRKRKASYKPVPKIRKIGFKAWYNGRLIGKWLCPVCGEPLYRRLVSFYSIRIFCLACGWEEKPFLTREQLYR